MNTQELRKLSVEELEKKLLETKKEIESMSFKLYTNELKDVSSVKKTKKTAARILTLLNEKGEKGE